MSRLKIFSLGILSIVSTATHAQSVEEYPSVALSASFTRDLHINKWVAGASIAARLDDATVTSPSIKPVPMLAAEWSAGEPSGRPKITFMGVPVDPSHRLNATGDGGSNWGWWVLGGVGVAAVAVIAASAGGGSGDNHSTPANCQNSTGVPPVATVQNCPP